MEQLKRMLRKVFCLPPLLTVFIAIPSLVFVFVMLGMEEHNLLSYISYGLSAYAIVILTTGITKIIRAVRQGVGELVIVKKIRSYPVGDRYLRDTVFRSEVSLYGGLAANLLYVALNLISGVRYQSAWFVTLAFYYAFLSVMRTILITQAHRVAIGQDIASEFRSYRICGIILLFMNQALAGIVAYIVNENRGFLYSGLFIYAMASYTFYITISAVIHVIKCRKHGSPVLSAAKVINLTAALVSVLSLETAMLAQFGEDDQIFRQTMTAVSGAAVCVIVLGMAIYMIIRSTKQLKKFKMQNSQM